MMVQGGFKGSLQRGFVLGIWRPENRRTQNGPSFRLALDVASKYLSDHKPRVCEFWQIFKTTPCACYLLAEYAKYASRCFGCPCFLVDVGHKPQVQLRM